MMVAAGQLDSVDDIAAVLQTATGPVRNAPDSVQRSAVVGVLLTRPPA
jgi:hypothetical protein